MRKMFLAAALPAASCWLGGCGPSKDPADASRRLVVWEQQDASVAPFIDSVFAAFKKLPGNDSVEVVRVHYHTEDLRQQFQTASIVGNPPDLIMGPSDPAGVFSVSGFILPVDDLFDLGRYNKPVVSAITLDGKAWGVPVSNGNHLLLFFNKRLAARAPSSTDELFEYCRTTAKRAGLEHCLALNLAEPFWLMPWLGAFGGWPIDNRTPTLDTPAMRAALSFLLDLTRGKKFVPPECDYNCVDGLFKESKVAFIVNGDWALSSYEQKFKGDLGVAKIPRLSQTGAWPTPMVSGQYFMLSSKLSGEKLALAKRLVEFYTNEENQVAQVRALMRLPALTSAGSSEAITRSPALTASMAQILVGKPMPMATEMRAVWDTMRQQLAQVVAGRIDPEQAARRMQADAVAKIREMNE